MKSHQQIKQRDERIYTAMGFLRVSLVGFLVAMAPSISSAAATNTVLSTVVPDKAMHEQAKTIRNFMKGIYKKLRLIKRMSRQKQ
jgi:hypothetical protein